MDKFIRLHNDAVINRDSVVSIEKSGYGYIAICLNGRSRPLELVFDTSIERDMFMDKIGRVLNGYSKIDVLYKEIEEYMENFKEEEIR